MDSNRKGNFILLSFILLLLNFWFWCLVEPFVGITGINHAKVVDIAIISFFIVPAYGFALYYYETLKRY